MLQSNIFKGKMKYMRFYRCLIKCVNNNNFRVPNLLKIRDKSNLITARLKKNST